jgi:hypothetical protein
VQSRYASRKKDRSMGCERVVMLWRKELGGDVECGACPFGNAIAEAGGQGSASPYTNSPLRRFQNSILTRHTHFCIIVSIYNRPITSCLLCVAAGAAVRFAGASQGPPRTGGEEARWSPQLVHADIDHLAIHHRFERSTHLSPCSLVSLLADHCYTQSTSRTTRMTPLCCIQFVSWSYCSHWCCASLTRWSTPRLHNVSRK